MFQSSPGAYKKEITLHACRVDVFAPVFEAAENVAAYRMGLEHQCAQQAKLLTQVQWLERGYGSGGCPRIRPNAMSKRALELHSGACEYFEHEVDLRVVVCLHEFLFWLIDDS